MIKELINIANKLDGLSLMKEADYIDRLIKRANLGDDEERVGDVSYMLGSKVRKVWNPDTGEEDVYTEPPEKSVFVYIEDVNTPGGDPERYYIMEALELTSDRNEWEGREGWEPEDLNAGEWKSQGYHMADEDDALGDVDYDPNAEPGEERSGKALIKEYLAGAPERAREEEEYESSWRQERAMQAGMGGGVDAYNEEMGWDLGPPED